MKVKNHKQVREDLKEYYRDAELWLPDDPSHRVFKVRKLDDDGEVHFTLIRDRITSKSKLRKQLVNLTPIDCYHSVSMFLNPTITREKTWKKKGDGRKHIDKNGFMYSDVVIDMDHTDREEVARLYDYLDENVDTSIYIVYSGGGWHINLRKWYRNRSIQNPIEREKDFEQQAQNLANLLIREGFEFDYQVQDSGKINSPTTDTRRVRKLPGTVTSYGNRSEVVGREELFDYSPTQVMSTIDTFNNELNFNTYCKEVNNSGGTDSRVLLENTKSES